MFCKLCSNPDQAKVRAAFASDASDREIGRLFGVSHMCAGRHRRNHVAKPLQAALIALDRGRTAHDQREQQNAAIEKGDPVAVVDGLLSREALVSEVQRISERNERMACVSEEGGSVQGVATASAQQIRAAEFKAKVGGIGGFAPARAADKAAQREPFVVNILFRDAPEKSTKISMLPVEQEIDADREQDDQPDEA